MEHSAGAAARGDTEVTCFHVLCVNYAGSIMYKSKLPFLLVFNKTDVTSHDFAVNWMKDFDSFSGALKSDDSYMSSLTRSMSLVLDEFYATIRTVGVSAVSGEGMPDLFAAIKDLTAEYNSVYAPALAAQKLEVEQKAAARKERQIAKMKAELTKDEHIQRGEQVVLDGGKVSAAAAAGRTRQGMTSIDQSGLIRTRPGEQRSAVRHPVEEELEGTDDEEHELDRFEDEDDAEHALPYDEDDREEEEEYVSEEAATKDKNDFEEFMSKIKGGQAPATSSKKTIDEGDENVEEIDTAKK
jgi:hypothetical protein